MKFEYLETDRLRLRKLTPEVYDYVYTHFNKAEIMSFIGLKNEDAFAADKARYEKGLKAYDRTFPNFSLIIKATEEVIGITGFVRHYPDHFRAELGYSLFDDQYKNKGFMFEATRPMISYCFQKMGLTRIEAMVGPNNIPSIKILES